MILIFLVAVIISLTAVSAADTSNSSVSTTDLGTHVQDVSSQATIGTTTTSDTSSQVTSEKSSIKSTTNDNISNEADLRENTKDNTPGIIHYEIVPGENIDITVAPKGFGSENMSRVYMLKPADGIDGVKDAVLDAGKDYKSFSGLGTDMDGEVKFIIETKAVEKED